MSENPAVQHRQHRQRRPHRGCRALVASPAVTLLFLAGTTVPGQAMQPPPELEVDTRPSADAAAEIAQQHQEMSIERVRLAAEQRRISAVHRPSAPPAAHSDTLRLTATSSEPGAVDTGPPGDSLGDLVTSSDELSDVRGRSVGHAAMACVRTSLTRGESQCTATLMLGRSGTLALQGVISDTASSLRIAVVGGTRKFSGAAGTMVVRGDPESPDRLLLTIRLAR